MSIYVTQQPLPYFIGGNRARIDDRIPTSSVSYRMWAGETPPTDGNADSPVTLGFEFYVTSAATLTEIRWYQPTTNSDGTARQGALWLAADGTQMVAPVTGAAPAAPGWQTIPVSFGLTPTTRYRVGVFHPNAGYVVTGGFFATTPDVVSGVITVPSLANATGNNQGVYGYAGAITFPNAAFNNSHYWTDITVAV